MTTLPWRLMVVSIGGFAVGVLVLALIAASIGGSFERTIIVFFISLTAVVGIGLFSGNSGILSFGHLAFMGIAAYASAILTIPTQAKSLTLPNLPSFLAGLQFEFWPAAIIATLFAMVVALVVGLAIARLEGAAATIATLALLIIVHGVIIGARDITRGSQSFFGVPRETTLVVAAIGCLIALVVARLFRESVPGLKLRASRENSIAAASNGISVSRERLIAWVISAGLVALAGAMLGHYLGAFSPKKFYFVDTFALLAMLIVGGMGSVTGAVLGAVTITLVTEILRRLESGVELWGFQFPEFFGATQVGIGLIILFVMFRRGEGLVGNAEWDELFPKRFGSWLRRETGGKSVSASGTVSADLRLHGKAVTKRFDGLVAVSDMDVTLAAGEIVGLIGPNGSGKTTLLNLMSGVLPVSGGQIEQGSLDLTRMPAHKMARLGIARTFQNIRLFGALSVHQNVMISALCHWPRVSVAGAGARSMNALQRMGMNGHAAAKANTLSYGDQRRVEIARALALDPNFLFLDEPAAGMNREETDALMGILKQLREELGLGILIVDHDLPLITSLCDRVLVLNEGHLIAQGTPEEIQSEPAVREAYMGRRHHAGAPA